MIQDSVELLGFMFLIVAFARVLEERFAFIKKISSAVVCTLLGILLANIGVIPHSSDVGRGVFEYAIPYSIVLVILSSRLGDLKRAGLPLVLSFLLAGLGSFVGAIVASLIFVGRLGPETWKLGGIFAGAFWGGGMNFAAVGQGLEVTPSLFAAATVADNLSTVPWMLAQVGLVTFLTPYYRKLAAAGEGVGPDALPVDEDALRSAWTKAELNIRDMALLAAVPLYFLYIARWLGEAESFGFITDVPEVLWLTTFAIIAAQIPAVQRLRGAAPLSYFALHLFFIALGASSNVGDVVTAGPSLFLFMILIIAVHALVVYGMGFLLRFDLPSLTIASQASVGGPGSALALGMALKWPTLVTPGIIIGIFGYAVGNYLGFATAYLLRSIL